MKLYAGYSKFCTTMTVLCLTNINELAYHSQFTVDKKVIQSLTQPPCWYLHLDEGVSQVGGA